MKVKVLLVWIVIGCIIVLTSCQNNAHVGIEPVSGESTQESESQRDEGTTDSHNNEILLPKYGDYLESVVAKQYSSADSASISVGHRVELSLSEDVYYDESVDSSIKFSVADVEYDLDYQGTTSGAFYQDTVHVYSNRKLTQHINVDTGKCTMCIFPKTDNSDTICSENELKEIANKFLIANVEDPESYLITYYKYIEGSLYVYYTRMVGDIETYDQIRVGIRENGDVRLYRMDHVGELKNVQPIPDQLIEKVHSELIRRGNDIYGLLGDGYSYTLSTEIDRLVRLDDGSLALDCHVDADITAPDGTKLSDGAWFIIPITEPTQ